MDKIVNGGHTGTTRDMRREGHEMSDKMYLRINEVAEHLGVSRATAYDLVNRGVIPSIRLEGRGERGILRVPAEALRKLAQKHVPATDAR